MRHLAWLTQAPQLIIDPGVFDVQSFLPDNYVSVLQSWDKNPGVRPDILNAVPHYRLGYYLESLYECLVRDLMGWTLLARNLPIRSGGLTHGELDFVVQNPHTGDVEHHETAIKFYLGHPGHGDLPSGWYGPNPRDRLDLKTARLLEQQSRRVQLPATATVLATLGIRQPALSRVFMPGYLFYPHMPAPKLTDVTTATTVSIISAPSPDLPVPDGVPANHLRGHWLYLNCVPDAGISHWVPLLKPHWLGPWLQADAPDSNITTDALARVTQTQTPQLFAILQHERITGLWGETDRVFVVPACWPRPGRTEVC